MQKYSTILLKVMDLRQYGRLLHKTFDEIPLDEEYRASVTKHISIRLISEKVKTLQVSILNGHEGVALTPVSL